MNFADIEKAWQSPGNTPAAAELEQRKTQFVAELQQRRRSARATLWFTAAVLAVITGRLLWQIWFPDPTLDRIDLTREWMVLPFFFLPWLGWLVMWRQQRRHRATHRDYDHSIQASIAALLAENRREGLRSLLTVGGLLVSLPLLGGVGWQLRAVGKMGDEALFALGVIYPAFVVFTVGWIGWHYARHTRPRRHELAGILADYQRSA